MMPRDLANFGGGGQVMLKPDSEFVWLEVLRDPMAPQRAAVWGHGGRRWLIGFTTSTHERSFVLTLYAANLQALLDAC